jgi:CubicO group peptidase (beta-lactamase class C family)
MRKIFSIAAFALSLSINSHAQISVDTAAVIKNDKQLYSIVVSQNDKIIYSHFFNGKVEQDSYSDQSLTKSVMSLLIGIAIEKGFISSVDEKIANFFPEIIQDTDRRKQDITIRDIMNHTSGLWHTDPGIFGTLGKYLRLPDQSGYVIQAPLTSEPGKVFYYNNAASHLLSVIITKSTGLTTLEFAKKYLFGPLEINNVGWEKMNDGYYDASGLKGVYMRTQDMNKIGALFLHNGRYHDQAVVPEKWIAELLHPAIFYPVGWGLKGSIYALCFYNCKYRETPVTYGYGWGGQYVFIIPDKHAVITVNESTRDATAIKTSEFFLDKIFPLIYDQLKDI